MSSQAKNTTETNNHVLLNTVSSAFFLAIAVLFPLHITRNHYIGLTASKADLFVTLVTITSIAILVILFLTTKRFTVRDYFVKGELRRLFSVSEWALIGFVLLGLFSSVFSLHQDIVWRGGALGRWDSFWMLFSYALAFFIVARYYKPHSLHLVAFACSAILVSLYGILQFVGRDVLVDWGFFINLPPLDYFSHYFWPPLSRLFRTTLGNTNIVAAYSSLVMVLFAGLFAVDRSRWSAFYIVASGMVFGLLIISRGDAGHIGVLGAMVLTVPYWVADRQRLGRMFLVMSCWVVVFAIHNGYLAHIRAQAEIEPLRFLFDQDFVMRFTPQSSALLVGAAILLLAVGLLLLFVVKKWPERVMKIVGLVLLSLLLVGGIAVVEIEGRRRADNRSDIIWQAREIMHGRIQDDFGSYRGFVWRRSVGVVMYNPILGTGPGTVYQALGDEFQQESLGRLGVVFDSVHNTYLQIAVTLGVPALIAYLVFLGGLFWPALKMAYTSPLLLAFGAAAISYLIQSFFQVDTPIDRPLLWVVLGVMSGEIWNKKIGSCFFYQTML